MIVEDLFPQYPLQTAYEFIGNGWKVVNEYSLEQKYNYFPPMVFICQQTDIRSLHYFETVN